MKRILVAVDASETAQLVVARAVELARLSGGKVRLVRAVLVEPLPPIPGVIAGTPLVNAQALVGAAEAGIRELMAGVPESLRDGMVVEIGSPAEVVCACARAFDADLVVIGAHRYGRLTRVLGSTASRIVNRIDRPVFVVRPMPGTLSVAETSKMTSAAGVLRGDHERLEKLYEALLAAYRRDDWTAVRAQWDVFEPALWAHMDTEENVVFPAFRAVDRDDADALLAEHAELRRLLGMLGVGIDLHVVSADSANELVERLRAHGRREERLLYPWLESLATARPAGPSSERQPTAPKRQPQR